MLIIDRNSRAGSNSEVKLCIKHGANDAATKYEYSSSLTGYIRDINLPDFKKNCMDNDTIDFVSHPQRWFVIHRREQQYTSWKKKSTTIDVETFYLIQMGDDEKDAAHSQPETLSSSTAIGAWDSTKRDCMVEYLPGECPPPTPRKGW